MAHLSLQRFVLICLLVGGVIVLFAMPTAARTAGGNNTTVVSNFGISVSDSASGNATGVTGAGRTNVSSLRPGKSFRLQNATSGSNNSSSGDGGGGGVVSGVTGAAQGTWNYATPNVPSTDQIANDTANWMKSHLLGATKGVLGTSIGFVVGTSHPKNSGAAGIFGKPTNAPYKGLYKSVYGPFSFQYSIVILLILLFAMVIVMPYAGLASGGTYRATQACARIVAALVLVMFWWPIGTALSQFFDAVATGIAPSATELTHSMKGLFKLSLGPILAGVTVYAVDFGEILALAFVYAFRQAALVLFQFAMPLILIFAYAGPHRRVRSMASTIAWQYFSLLLMTIPTAFIMRIAFAAHWGFGLGVLGNALISIALLSIALATPFVFSIAAFRAPPSIQTLAGSAAGAAVAGGSTILNDGPSGDDNDGNDDDDDGDGGTNQQTVYVEDTTTQDRTAAATDGGTNYTNATARGPRPAPGGAIGDGSANPTGFAHRIRDFEKRSAGQSGGSAAAQTQHYNQNNAEYVESTVVNEGDSS